VSAEAGVLEDLEGLFLKSWVSKEVEMRLLNRRIGHSRAKLFVFPQWMNLHTGVA
jgi:hypothetical protein